MKKTVLQMRSVEAADHLFGQAVDINLTLYAGEVMVMTGLVTSGIHTVTRLLSGAVPEYRGQILVNGEEMRLSNVRGTLQSGLVVFGQGKLYFDQFSLEDNRNLFQNQGKMMRLVRPIHDSPDVQELLSLLALPKDDGAVSAFTQLKREIFLAYTAGVGVMVFSDVSMCCTGTASKEFNAILEFLKGRGVGILLTVLNDQFKNFEGIADSCVVIRNGMTANQIFRDGRGYFDADTVHHITVGRAFVHHPLPQRQSIGDREASNAVAVLESLHTGRRVPLYAGQLVGIYDEHAHIPTDIEGFTGYLAAWYRLHKDGRELRLSLPGDLARNRIAVLHNTDVERMIFPNMSPVENVSFSPRTSWTRRCSIARRWRGIFSTRWWRHILL